MDITSLLQEAPSRDRTKRKQQPWEDSPVSSKPLTTGVEEILPSMRVVSASFAGDYNPPGPSVNDPSHQQPSRSFPADSEYPLPASNNPQSQSQSQQQPSSSYSYYQKHPEREKERTGLPLNPPPDYIDVDTAEGTIRMKKQDYLKQSQLVVRPLSSPASQHIPLSDSNLANTSLSRVPSARNNGSEEITAQAVVVNHPLPPPPRTPSPVLDAVHLGLYIYPSLPFPIRPSAIPYNRRTTLTVLIPSSLLPHHHSTRTTTLGIYADSRARRLWGGVPHKDQRKIYTDDSDVVFAALHSETIPDDPTLFSSGKDLQLTLRLYPAPESGHFTGGKGAAGLTSAAWGNAHEGCAYTIQEATWVAPSTSRGYTRQTRKARMAEYAQRRATIMSSSSSSLLLSPSPSPEVPKSSGPAKSLPLKPEMHPIEENMATLSVVGGWRAAVGFKYDPMTLYLMLFALTSSSSSLHVPKRRKLDPPGPNREIILASSRAELERLILVPKPPPPRNQPDSAMEIDDVNAPGSSVIDGFMRYDLYREVRDPPTVPSELKVEVSEPIKPKGVHFTAEVVDKDESRDPDNISWTRTLLHSDLGPQDILCIPDCLIVGDNKYAVDTWRWKSGPDDGKRSAGKASQATRSKKRGLKKRKMKARKPKGDGAAAETAPLETEGTSGEVVGSKSAVAEAPPTTHPDNLGGDTSKAPLLPASEASVTAPAPIKDDREEGELSDGELSDDPPAVAQ